MKIDFEYIVKLLCMTAIAVAIVLGVTQCSSVMEDATARKEEARELTNRELIKQGLARTPWIDSWEKIK